MRMTAGRFQRYVGWAALAVALFVAGRGYILQQESNDRAACQTQVNQEFLTVIKQRSALATESTQIIDELIQSVFTAKDPKTAQADYQKFVKELETINGELKRATYPAIGRC